MWFYKASFHNNKNIHFPGQPSHVSAWNFGELEESFQKGGK